MDTEQTDNQVPQNRTTDVLFYPQNSKLVKDTNTAALHQIQRNTRFRILFLAADSSNKTTLCPKAIRIYKTSA
ncbi:hypothetical protein DSL72_004369 [Monilinia vaccinii-corymbosi]|uniref:Uncharacterized protein n=1 Tax=Monilinia vaccinii-corymbosi TaxID=61207 RepID=A0A8A3P4H6_9HELO|nr:hypothetical protein DSL72_004369 [Monilinia vaccinii-corymbosi]